MQSTLDHWISVHDAAKRLRVSEPRVRQLIDAGELAARQMSGRWFVAANSVEERARLRPSAGRPVGASAAWALVDLASPPTGDIRSSELALRWSQIRDRRLRHRLRKFVDANPPGTLWKDLLRGRAERRRYWAHPGVVDSLLADRRVSAGGARAAAQHGLHLSPGGDFRGYVLERYVRQVVHDYGLEADPAGSVELLVIPDSADPAYTPEPGEAVPVIAAILDLLESADSRSQHLAENWLEALATAVDEQIAKSDSGQ